MQLLTSICLSTYLLIYSYNYFILLFSLYIFIDVFFFLVVPILLCLYLRKHCMEEGRALIFSVFFLFFFFISMILSWQLQNFKNKRNYNFQKVIVTLFLRIFALFFKVCFTLMEHKKEVTKKLFLTCFLYCFVFCFFYLSHKKLQTKECTES